MKKEEFSHDLADYYDLIIGPHPDEATRAVALAAKVRPTILVPCCNFWDRSRKLGRNALLAEIGRFYRENRVEYETITFDFTGPKNIGLVTMPVLTSSSG